MGTAARTALGGADLVRPDGGGHKAAHAARQRRPLGRERMVQRPGRDGQERGRQPYDTACALWSVKLCMHNDLPMTLIGGNGIASAVGVDGSAIAEVAERLGGFSTEQMAFASDNLPQACHARLALLSS